MHSTPTNGDRGYRFLADRGIPPKYVWLSRQSIAFGPPLLVLAALLLAGVFLATLFLPNPLYFPRSHGAPLLELYAGILVSGYSFFAVFGYLVLGITVGQLASMFLRSGLLAGLLCIVLTGLLVGWSAVMWVWHVSWLWSVLPIPLVLLLASRLRTRNWLLERNTLRAWLPPLLMLLVPAAALLMAVPLYRVYGVPAIDPGFSLEEYDRPLTPEEQITLNTYMHACLKSSQLGFEAHNRLFKTREGRNRPEVIAAETAWVKENRGLIGDVMKAGKMPLPARVVERLPQFQTAYLIELLICSATQLEELGKLDAAIEQYMAAIKIAVQLHAWYPIEWPGNGYERDRGDQLELEAYARLPRWAARPGQTPERILAAVRAVGETHVRRSHERRDQGRALSCPTLSFGRRRCDQSEPKSATHGPCPPLPSSGCVCRGKRARALRLLDRVTQEELAVLANSELRPQWQSNPSGISAARRVYQSLVTRVRYSLRPAESSLRAARLLRRAWGSIRTGADLHGHRDFPPRHPSALSP